MVRRSPLDGERSLQPPRKPRRTALPESPVSHDRAGMRGPGGGPARGLAQRIRGHLKSVRLSQVLCFIPFVRAQVNRLPRRAPLNLNTLHDDIVGNLAPRLVRPYFKTGTSLTSSFRRAANHAMLKRVGPQALPAFPFRGRVGPLQARITRESRDHVSIGEKAPVLPGWAGQWAVTSASARGGTSDGLQGGKRWLVEPAG